MTLVLDGCAVPDWLELVHAIQHWREVLERTTANRQGVYLTF